MKPTTQLDGCAAAPARSAIINTEPVDAFALLKRALSPSDITTMAAKSAAHLSAPDAIPSYVFLDEATGPLVTKIRQHVEAVVGCELHYLNDFYIYTEGTTQAAWHVDTEMFTFARAYNAWVLLSPDEVASPLAVMADGNRADSDFFHTMKPADDGASAVFANLTNGEKRTASLRDIEAQRLHAPDVSVGDILILNPLRFHRTNIQAPKHVLAFKFVAELDGGFASQFQVPSFFWPETKIFNAALDKAHEWGDVLEAIRGALQTPAGRKALSAGFFPERLDLFRDRVTALAEARSAL